MEQLKSTVEPANVTLNRDTAYVLRNFRVRSCMLWAATFQLIAIHMLKSSIHMQLKNDSLFAVAMFALHIIPAALMVSALWFFKDGTREQNVLLGLWVFTLFLIDLV